MKVPTGLCGCGCGAKTRVAARTHASDGHIKGVPLIYIRGHQCKGRRKIGSAQWLKENDLAAYRSYRCEILKRWSKKHKAELKKYYARYKSVCPLCFSPMTRATGRTPAIMCWHCYGLLRLITASKAIPHEEMSEFVKTITQGELEAWQSAITLRKATKPLRKLLNSREIIHSSPTSGKTKRYSSS